MNVTSIIFITSHLLLSQWQGKSAFWCCNHLHLVWPVHSTISHSLYFNSYLQCTFKMFSKICLLVENILLVDSAQNLSYFHHFILFLFLFLSLSFQIGFYDSSTSLLLLPLILRLGEKKKGKIGNMKCVLIKIFVAPFLAAYFFEDF